MADILIVDDNAFNRDLLLTLAHHAGHRTAEARDGAQALALAMRSPPDLIVCDILMPTMDGYEFVRRLRAQPEIAHTRVMFYTANFREREARTLADALGVRHILCKPCEPDDILRAIERALADAPRGTPEVDEARVAAEHRQVLTDKLAEKVQELQRANERLAVLTELNLQLSSAQDYQALLIEVCRGARELVGARYALACVDGGDGVLFHGAGMSREEMQRLAPPNLEAGMFGEVMQRRQGRRFRNPGGQAQAIGLPSGYPQVHDGVIVPVLSPGSVYGWLCMMGKVGAEEFTTEDEWLSSAHGAQVGRILENSALLRSLQGRSEALRAEVEERRRIEVALERTGRARRVLAECNRVLMRASDEASLLADMCRTAVEQTGNYVAAWVVLEGDARIEVAAHAGDPRTQEDPRAAELVESARLQSRPCTGRIDVQTPAGPRGMALVALPLLEGARAFGALAIAAPALETFDDDELLLLGELAEDIAFGLHTLRERERKRLIQRGLDRTERMFEATFEQSAVGIAHLDFDGRFLRANHKLCELLGLSRARLLERTLLDVTPREDAGATRELLAQLARFGESASSRREQRYLADGGHMFWGQSTISAVRDEQDGYAILVLEDISERKHYESELLHQATHDALTGLANRVLLSDRMEQAILFASREGESIAVILLDLDHFKRINDGIGHTAGDRLLQEVARRLGTQLRRSDTLARLGGDEFMIIAPGLGTESAVAAFVGNLLNCIAEPIDLGDRQTVVSASLGLSIYPRDGDSAELLFKHADVAMYRAKAQGRNGFRFFAAEFDARTREQLDLEMGLRRALRQGGLELHYQPKVELRSGRIVGAEALLRWRLESGELLLPGRFIPMAEEIDLIEAIGSWVIEQACEQLRIWQAQGAPRVPLAVNVSARQFEGQDLTLQVAQALHSHGIAPECLVLELTESAVMRNPENARETLQRLRLLGVRISLDDFGTGYSSLSYLMRFPIDSLKIDQSFVADIAQHSDGAAIASLVVSLARNLGRTVVAEGVENEAQLAFLRDCGCDEGQGFLFSKALPAEAFERLLRQDRPFARLCAPG